MDLRVLILGAGGFIGRRIVAALAATSWARPVAAGRHDASLPAGPGVEIRALDATDPVQVGPALEGVGAVVNCVAGSAPNIVSAAREVFAAAARSGAPPRIVHLSSLAVYGSARGEVDESTPLSGTHEPYGAAKLIAEQLALAYPRAVILRPGIVYGPASPWWSDRIARLLVARRLGDLGAAAQGVCNLVHVDDVAEAVVRALRAVGVEGQIFNLALPQPPTWNEYFRRYAEALGATPVRHISGTQLTLELALRGPLIKVTEMLGRSGGVPPVRPWLLRLCRHDITMRAQRIVEALGLTWTPLERGLAGTAAWFRAGNRTN
ncbi:MAG TPA: NAD-dependent epimerase/dehydratase family protein [Steroidobacteraceae bacterium]|nr:NAD-dependent epimerase/dehydratase family protein [Steroidobacteraceae bacterium]